MSDTVAKRSKSSAHMLEQATKGRALMGGSSAMRAAGEIYLPKFQAEDPRDYEARLNASWLFNGYRKTVRDNTGRVFEAPVELGEQSPPRIVEWCENADLQGNDLSTFARAVFEDGMSGSGISYIMVDAPPRQGTVTQADAAAQNLRPYLVHLRVEDVLGWKSEAIANVQTLTQLRIMETVHEPDPDDEFKEIEVAQVRVIDRLPAGAQTRIYRKNARDQWTLEGEPTFSGLPDITVVPFYANRTGFFMGSPLLDDLADVNVAHWQSQSDQRNILHVARVPILFAAGFPDDSPIVVGSKQAVVSSDSTATLTWTEHTGAAIGAGRQDLKDLEFQMEALGLQLLAASPGAQSATGEALDAAKETSTLAMTADALKDALEMALIWMAQYGGEDGSNIEAKVNKEFGVGMMTAQEMTVLLTAVNTGNMSRATFLGELKRRGMVQADLDVDDEAERISDEGGDVVEPSLGGE